MLIYLSFFKEEANSILNEYPKIAQNSSKHIKTKILICFKVKYSVKYLF